MGEIIMILLLLLPVIFIGLIAYVMKVYDNTNDDSDDGTKDRVNNDTNDDSDDGTKDRVNNDTNDDSDDGTKDRVNNDTNDDSDDGTKDRVNNDTNDDSDDTVNIGDVFVYEPLCIISSDPFEDVSTVRDMDSSRTYIVDDLKTNYEGVVWVKYHTLITHQRKKCFYHTTPIDAFLYRTYKRNELKYLFE